MSGYYSQHLAVSLVAWRRKCKEGRDVDIRKEVEHAFPREKVDVTAQLESLCRFVHLE